MRKIDLRLPLIGVILIALIFAAISINNEHSVNDSNQITSLLEIDDRDENIDWERYQTVDIDLEESYHISESGTYHLTGSLDNGFIEINAGVGKVKLLLDNVNINNATGPAIYCSSADELVIESIGTNSLSDGGTYSEEYDEDVTGTIYSKTDLTFGGEGSLIIKSHFADSIVGKDDVKFKSGKYHITAVDDAIRGKDSVYIVNGDFTIETDADAIKTTNETRTGKGFVLIENGQFSISASAKGIKAPNVVMINGGNLTLETYDDAIHSDSYVCIKGGSIDIKSGDDGVHANGELLIEGGEIRITEAYEGLEAQQITIANSEINLKTIDDGINAGGGADGSANNRPGSNPFKTDENCILTINSGEIYINAIGDGVDSNGWIYINGGELTIDGPDDDSNGALDAGTEIVMNGGKVFAIGASGMAGSIGQNSNINSISVYFEKTLPAKTNIVIKNEKRETLFSHTSNRSFSHLAAGTESFVLGSKYTIYLNNEKYKEIMIGDITTTIGDSHNNLNIPRPH